MELGDLLQYWHIYIFLVIFVIDYWCTRTIYTLLLHKHLIYFKEALTFGSCLEIDLMLKSNNAEMVMLSWWCCCCRGGGHCGRKRTALLEHNCDELLQLTPARLSRIQPQTFQMLWPSTTTNYGGRGMQIVSLWHQKYCGHRPQLTMATKGRKWTLCDLNLA